MPISYFTLPQTWQAQQSVKAASFSAKLGDGYELNMALGTNPVSDEWQIRSPLLTTTQVDNYLAQLAIFSGDTIFYWSPDNNASVPYAAYTCDQWTYKPMGKNKWQLEATFKSSGEGQCLAYAAFIDETAILSQLQGAISWIATYTKDTEPYVINAQGVSRNSFHRTLGRAGYLTDGSGTTEGQAALIRSLLVARQTSSLSAPFKAQALATANLLASVLVPVFYNGEAIPTNPTAGLWLPHWVVNASEAFTSKGAQSTPDYLNYGNFSLAVNFTSGVGTIPSGSNGLLLADVYRVYSVGGKLLWQNVYAPVVVGTEYPVDYWVTNVQLKGQNYRFRADYQQPGASAPVPTSETAGKIVLGGSAANFTGTAVVVHSTYTGAVIAKNTGYDAYPMWRPLLTGERNHAFDVSWWIYDAYVELFNATGDTQWQRAAEATKYSTFTAATIQNESYLFKKEVGVTDPFSYPGTQIVISNNSAGAVATRAADGGIQVAVANGPEAFPSAELQNFAVTVAAQTGVTFEVEVANSVATLMEVVLSTSKNAFDFSQLYTFWLPVAADLTAYTSRSIKPQEFVKWGTGTLWHPTNAASPVYTFSGSGGTVSAVREYQVIDTFTRLVYRITMDKNSGFAGAGFVLFNQGNKPPALYYSSSSNDLSCRVRDSAGNDFHFLIPSSGGAWQLFTPSWDDSYNTTIGVTNPADGAILNVEIVPNIGSGDGNGTISVWYVGDPPNILPAPVYIYKTAIVSRVDTAHTFKAGTVQALNSPLNTLKYNPGAVPFTVNIISGAVDAWRGSLYAGYQSPVAWQKWGHPERAAQVYQALSDAQDAYGKQSLSGIVGPFTPVFLWAVWSEGAYGDINTWGWVGPDPNTRWGQYAYRALEAAAKGWYLNRSNKTAQAVVMRFLGYLDRLYRTNASGQPPTDIPPQSDPVIGYHDPAAAALILRAALYANLAGGNPGITFRVIKKSLEYLASQYVSSGVMAGSFAASQPTFTVGGVDYKEFFGFWQAEIIEALALTIQLKGQITYPACSVPV